VLFEVQCAICRFDQDGVVRGDFNFSVEKPTGKVRSHGLLGFGVVGSKGEGEGGYHFYAWWLGSKITHYGALM
jgi:hypothetical protein